MMKHNISSLHKTLIFILIYALTAFALNFSLQTVAHLILTLGFGSLLFVIYQKFSPKKKSLANTFITVGIIFLILHYSLSSLNIIYTLSTVFIAITYKFFLEYKGFPIINPAVFALLFVYFIAWLLPVSNPFISWWGVDFGNNILPINISIALIFIAIWIVFFFGKWRKYPLLISFLLSHAIFHFLFQQNLDLLQFIFTNATIYFLAGIMLSDPKTSPILKQQQVIFGIIAALSYNILLYFNIPQYDLLAIATANIYFFIAKSIKTHQLETKN